MKGYTIMKYVRGISIVFMLHLSVHLTSAQEARRITDQETGLWTSHSLKTPYRENISDDEKIAGLSELWSEVKYNFANFDLVPELDWDNLYLSYLPKVRQTKSTLEYYRLLVELCALLKDGHTNVYPPEALANELDARPPLRTALIERSVFVTEVWSDSLRRAGLHPGLEVVAIDGVPVHQYAERYIAPYESSSSKQDLEVRVYTYSLLSGSINQDVELTVRDLQGNTFKRKVRRGGYTDVVRTPQPSFAFRVLEGNVGYVALNSFEDANVTKMFSAAFGEIQKTDALILDLRLNGGGNDYIGFEILGYLTDKKIKTSRWRTRQYLPAFRAWGRGETWYSQEEEPRKPNGARHYSKPVVILTSGRTFSAAEDFCVAFDYMKRGTIIGEPTGGSTGQPLLFALPGGGSARVCTKRDLYPDGKEFIGIGVQPQIIVHPTIADFRASRDTTLEAALRKLKQP